MDKLVSVIIPIYGVEKELPRCLDSLLAQTYSNFELLLIDDGSKDGSYRVMEEYARRDGQHPPFPKRKRRCFLGAKHGSGSGKRGLYLLCRSG